MATSIVGQPNDQSRVPALLRLKPELYALRAAYRATTVEVNYANIDRIAAYMLAYFPHYVYMAYEVLRQGANYIPIAPTLNVAFFGGGPLPEVIGLLEALRDAQKLPARLNINGYDLCGDWSPAVDITTTLARELNPEVAIEINCEAMDFRQAMSTTVRESLIDRHLVVLQNCCNEMVSSTHYQANLEALTGALRQGAIIVLADQSKYSASVAAIERIEATLRADPRYEVLRTFSADDPEVRSRFTAPIDVRDNFFDGVNRKDPLTGLWPTGQFERSKLNFSYTLARKVDD